MTLTIKLEVANLARDDKGAEEVRRILSDLCDRLPEAGRWPAATFDLRDANGKPCGEAHII